MSRHDGPELEDAQGGHECIADTATARADSATQNRYGRSPGNVSLAGQPDDWTSSSGLAWPKPASGPGALRYELLHYVEAVGVRTPDGIGLVKTFEWHKNDDEQPSGSTSAYALPESLDAACNG